MCKSVDYIVKNWKNIVSIAAVAWSAFGFVYIIFGLPNRVKALEEEIEAYKIARLPPRVETLEGDVRGIKNDIYQIKADLQENFRITLNTYTLVKELRDDLVRESLKNGHQK